MKKGLPHSLLSFASALERARSGRLRSMVPLWILGATALMVVVALAFKFVAVLNVLGE